MVLVVENMCRTKLVIKIVLLASVSPDRYITSLTFLILSFIPSLKQVYFAQSQKFTVCCGELGSK